MPKYEKLGAFLNHQHQPVISLTFKEIEEIVGSPLPRSARYPAWWSNNPSNNVMTKVWLAAGFKTAQVDIVAQKLVFRRVKQAPSLSSHVQSPTGMADGGRAYVAPRGIATRSSAPSANPFIHPAFGSMKGLITVAPGVDLTAPAADPKSWKPR